MLEIKNIKKTNSSKYKIEFLDNTKIDIYDNVLLKHNILFKKKIDDQLLEKINEDNNKEEAYQQVVKYISKKIRCRKEIICFLNELDIDEDEKERIIYRLEQNRLINDELYASAYVQDRMLLSSDGPNKIKEDLLNNNIDMNVINNLLSNFTGDEVYNKLEKLINKKIRTNTNKSNYALKQKILYEMQTLGYDIYLINQILDNISIDNDSIIEKEYHKLYRKLSSKLQGNSLEQQIYYKLRSKGFTDYEIKSINKDK